MFVDESHWINLPIFLHAWAFSTVEAFMEAIFLLDESEPGLRASVEVY